MIVRGVRWIDSDNFDTFSPVPVLDLCCIDRSLEYCCFMSFPSNWLEQLNFEMRYRQVHSDPRARVLLVWQNVEVFSFVRLKGLNFTSKFREDRRWAGNVEGVALSSSVVIGDGPEWGCVGTRTNRVVRSETEVKTDQRSAIVGQLFAKCPRWLQQ